jgi:hypothetical protein
VGGVAGDPDRSPTTLASADSRLRLHLRRRFGRHKVGEIKQSLVRQWQQELHGRPAHASVLACRSLLNRILQAAEDEGLLAANPVRKVPPPRRPVDPEVIFGRARPPHLHPKQLGRLLAHAEPEDRDRLLVLVGTGLRAGELCGLRRERVQLRAATRRPSWASERGSAMGAVYRHTTAEMGPGWSARSIPGLRWTEQSLMRSGDGLRRRLMTCSNPARQLFVLVIETRPPFGRWAALCLPLANIRSIALL